jgi:hypothetical protein
MGEQVTEGTREKEIQTGISAEFGFLIPDL